MKSCFFIVVGVACIAAGVVYQSIGEVNELAGVGSNGQMLENGVMATYT